MYWLLKLTEENEQSNMAECQTRCTGCLNIANFKCVSASSRLMIAGVHSPASLALSVMASIFSSLSDGLSSSSSNESSFLSNRAGMASRAHILRVLPMLEGMAGEPRDMGLSEQEFCPNPLAPRPVLGGAMSFTGDPGARFRRAFSLSIMGDIWGGIQIRDKSKGQRQAPHRSVAVSSVLPPLWSCLAKHWIESLVAGCIGS